MARSSSWTRCRWWEVTAPRAGASSPTSQTRGSVPSASSSITRAPCPRSAGAAHRSRGCACRTTSPKTRRSWPRFPRSRRARASGLARLDAVAPARFREVHRLIGSRNDDVQRLSFRCMGDADRRGDAQRRPVRQREGSVGDRAPQALGGYARARFRGVGEARDELFPAPARDQVALSSDAPNDLGYSTENYVTPFMAPRVVDLLEVVDVEEHHGERVDVPSGAGDLARHRFDERATIE